MTTPIYDKTAGRFRSFVGFFLFSVLALIVIGSMVRSTGAGLGCPDWPRCFGLWIPPVSVDQLPSNYLSLYDGIPFNPLKTWTEYLNRLSGVLVGIFATIMMLWSFRFWHTQRSLTRLAIGSWLLVGINGGIGAWVVSSRLAPVVISLHMVLAMLLIAVASRLYWVVKSEEKLDALSASSVRYYWLFVGVFLIQMVLGIELRQLMDLASHAGLARIEWLPSAGAMFWIHRSFSWVVLLSAWILLLKSPLSRRHFARGIFAMVILQMLTGMGLAYSGMLFAMQPLHLVLSAGAIVFVLGFKTTQEAEGKKR